MMYCSVWAEAGQTFGPLSSRQCTPVLPPLLPATPPQDPSIPLSSLQYTPVALHYSHSPKFPVFPCPSVSVLQSSLLYCQPLPKSPKYTLVLPSVYFSPPFIIAPKTPVYPYPPFSILQSALPYSHSPKALGIPCPLVSVIHSLVLPQVYCSSPFITATPQKSSVNPCPPVSVLQYSLHYSHSPKVLIIALSSCQHTPVLPPLQPLAKVPSIPLSSRKCTPVLRPLQPATPQKSSVYPCPPLSVIQSSLHYSHSPEVLSIPLSSCQCIPVLPPLQPLPQGSRIPFSSL